jgi:predicted AlkP superfamily pyrophosphatase or phosphodiesterase
MLKRYLLLFLCFIITNSVFSQNIPTPDKPNKPKLIIGIVVDQMRYDFITRYWDKYGTGGFKRLLAEGYSCDNTHYNYVPTYTGPGHSAIFTGSVPAIDGVIANAWYDRSLGRDVYCVEDDTAHTIGANNNSGKMSPDRLLVTTITDELKLSDNMNSKCIGISLKDRAAILPAGHAANAAYWFDNKTNNMVSSSYYMQALPKWVNDFNDQKLVQKYLSQPWTTLLPITQYTESTADNMPFEDVFKGETSPVFPHDLPTLSSTNPDIIRTTPFGDSYTADFAIATIKGEQLGKGQYTDFLTINFASTDYVGHQFGPNSIETEDTYLRLDKDLANLLTFLDSYLGKDNVLIFLTADHGVAEVPAYAQMNKIPAGVFSTPDAMKALKQATQKAFGADNLIAAFENQEIYFNDSVIDANKISERQLMSVVTETLMKMNGVANVIRTGGVIDDLIPDFQQHILRNSFNAQRSGDLYVIFNPGWFEDKPKGTTHGTFYNYDLHVPLLWYGWKIKNGSTTLPTETTDIAPTIAALLKIMEPNGCVGKPIQDIVK